MAVQVNRSRVDELMNNIVELEFDPGVFRVNLVKSDHTGGYEAIAVFRGSEKKEICLGGYNPEVALGNLYTELLAAHAPCPYCKRSG